MAIRERLRSMKTWLIAAMFVGALSPQGVEAQVTVAPVIDGKDATDVVATRPDISFAFEVANNSAKAAKVTITPGAVFRQDSPPCNETGNDGCRLAWTIDSKVSSGEKATARTLAPGQRAILRFSGRAPSLGVYETSLAVLEAVTPGKPATVVRLRVTRKHDDFGTSPIIAINGSRFVSWSGGSIPIQVKNNGARAVQLDTAPAARLSRDDDEGTFATSSGREPIPCLPLAPAGVDQTTQAASISENMSDVDENGLAPAITKNPVGTAPTSANPHLLAPGETYDCEIAIPHLPAGKYRARLRIDQATVTGALGDVDFSVRLSFWIAAIILLVFSIFGAIIAHWQNVGRQRMLQAASAMELHVRFTQMETRAGAGAPQSAQIAHATTMRLAALIAAIDQRSAADVEAELRKDEHQLTLLTAFVDLEARYLDGGGDPDAEVFTTAVTAVETVGDQADARLSALRQAIGDPPPAVGNTFAGAMNLIRRVAQGMGISLNNAQVLRRRVAFIDNILLAASVALACVIGVFALWYPNPAWGTGPDLVVAALTGLGTTVGSALSLNSLVSSYTLGRVGGAA